MISSKALDTSLDILSLRSGGRPRLSNSACTALLISKSIAALGALGLSFNALLIALVTAVSIFSPSPIKDSTLADSEPKRLAPLRAAVVCSAVVKALGFSKTLIASNTTSPILACPCNDAIVNSIWLVILFKAASVALMDCSIFVYSRCKDLLNSLLDFCNASISFCLSTIATRLRISDTA